MLSLSRTGQALAGRHFSARRQVLILTLSVALIASWLLPALGSRAQAGLNRVSGASGREPASQTGAAIDSGGSLRRFKATPLAQPDGDSRSYVSMVAGDFDEDGVDDLLTASEGGTLKFWRGNIASVFPAEARQQSDTGRASSSPFFGAVPVAELGETPTFLKAGDFLGNGHLDLVAGTRGSNVLYLLGSDGRGNFGAMNNRLQLPGALTALAGDDARNRRGAPTLALAVTAQDKDLLLVPRFDAGTGDVSFRSLRLGGPVSSLALSDLDGDGDLDIAIAGLSQLSVVRMRDLDNAADGTQVSSVSSEHWSFPFSIKSLTAGHFSSLDGEQLALLGDDGNGYVLSPTSAGRADSIKNEPIAFGSWPGAASIERASCYGGGLDDLAVLDKSGQLHLVKALKQGGTGLSTQETSSEVAIDAASAPTAVLAMRLNQDAFDDLVVLTASGSTPLALTTQAAMTFTVINTSDSGAGSLRQAITDANGNMGADNISFNIPGGPPFSITLATPLPAITDPVTLDATTQPGFTGLPVVELNGNGLSADGLTISAGSSVVRGLAINRFLGNAVVVDSNGGNLIQGNFIGTDTSGSIALGNNGDGIVVSNVGTNTIGGTVASARNLISGNHNGVQLAGAGSANNLIRGNFIGTNAAGTGSLGNSIDGVRVNGGVNNTIGGTGAGAGNTIAFNAGNGANVLAGTGNAILSNSIFSNTNLGIDLGGDGVTPNDAVDPDTGANNLQNFPTLSSANAAAGSVTIQGTLDSKPNTTFRIEFFSNNTASPSGFGEGQTLIAASTVTTDAGGNAAINITFPSALAPGQIISATATDSAGNTSEFSRVVQLAGSGGGTAADVSINVSIAPISVQTGGDITKTILVSNLGPGAATDLTVTDVLSPNLSFVSCSASSGGVCGGSGNNRTVTFASLSAGTSAVITITARVNCSVVNGLTIGNTAVAFSPTTPDPNPANNIFTATASVTNPPPQITCPPSFTVNNDPGKCASVVSYPAPVASDNCAPPAVICTPPSGGTFPAGVTNVTCVATDAAGATTTCSFTITVKDTETPTSVCPADVVVQAAPGQCTPSVTYPLPTVVDNCTGATVTCTPPSGSAFPVGSTLVTCTTVDSGGGRSTCSFSVRVNSPPVAIVRLEGGASALDLGPVAAGKKTLKKKKQPVRTFTIANDGCTPLVVSLDSILRTGNAVDNGTISDPDDRTTFLVKQRNADGTETDVPFGTDITIGAGVRRTFAVRFNPVLPAVQGKTRGLRAKDVLPNVLTSQLTFIQNGGPPLVINLVGRVATPVRLINPDVPRRKALVTFTRSGDQFIVEYSIFDSNLDVNRATYQFFDSNGRPVQDEFSADLTGVISDAGFVKGQSFTLVQRFNGAEDNDHVAGVLVTVFDPESSFAVQTSLSDSSDSVLQPSSTPGAASELPAVQLAHPQARFAPRPFADQLRVTGRK